jgi:predicted DNA-binding transcriptional regulator AlpA
MANRPAWTLTEAVERTGASRSTLRRYREAGRFPNAYKDTSNVWRFPLEDLLAAGLSVSEPAADHVLTTTSEQASTTSAEQVNRLEQALRDERIRADNAERLAASYLANVEDLRRALLMLEAGTGKPEQPAEHALSKSTEQGQNSHAASTEHGVNRAEQPTESSSGGKPDSLWRRWLSRR